MLGERIRQARLLAGLTQSALANALTGAGHPATKAVISKYEKNKSTPSAPFLLLAASILDVPSSYFTHQPTLEVTWLAFRRHSSLPAREQQAIKAYAADVAELQIELQDLLHPGSGADLLPIKAVTSVEEAEQAAMRLRECWGLDDRPIDSLVQTAEDHQVIVVGWRSQGGEFDGLSGWCEQRPVTVLSTAADTDRRRFTLAHELGHLVMDTRALAEKVAEKLAHRFAAALLVPADRALHELGARRTRLDWEELAILKRKYGLSIAAWIFRANDLNIITEHHAKTLWQELSHRGWRTKEPVEYIGDESPVQLDQMAHRAVAEGLISPDQIRRVYPEWIERSQVNVHPGHLTIYDLLAMPEAERQYVMEAAFALAAQEKFETFDAFEEMDFNDAAF
jgi:Zn-dependent peptidase ImmA (M78 family)/transcriptional regulator with XRE-family HTH domain